jgi:hypothetical protein
MGARGPGARPVAFLQHRPGLTAQPPPPCRHPAAAALQVMVMEYVDGGAVLAGGKAGTATEPLTEPDARQYFR